MIAGTRAAPVQVGVWIPKAKLGPTADFFRPLGMPNTCDRLVDAIAAVIMKATSAYMHPSQVVMNCFKEPQHAVNAIQTLLDGSTPMAALLVDLSKAFERVNPYWILHILRMRRTVEVPLSQPCFEHFFRPCFRGHDEAGLLAFEAPLRGSPRPARGQASDAKRNGTRTKRGSRGLESI